MKPILVLLLACAASTTNAGDFPIDGRTFRVPDGFMVEKVAGPPLVDRPIVADFDELGRLYVADSSGSNEDPKKQLANPTHRIVRLEDTNGDGKFDKSIVFADKMMFPEGAMWRNGSLFVAAPPSIWKLTDTDGDGVCDKREEWFKGKTLTGCANDLHGPYNGPDGWIYWTKGAFAEQTYTLPNGKPFTTRAAHIFRARPDGSGIEPVITGGMDNPVEIAWSPGGEMFFTTTFLQHPGGGKRDGIIHGVYGGLYGKDHDVLDGHIRTGPDLMPVMTHLGPAAPSGLMRYESSAFGTAYKDNLFCAQFNMHKVSRHVLEPVGATFKTIDSDFLTVAENQDFHPTDVLEDADGSILVLDTGGWYKLCCPTSQIGKPDVLGAIYRVRRINAETFEDPRGLKLDWTKLSADELVKRLDDPRMVIRHRSIESLRKRGFKAWSALADVDKTEGSADLRRNAIWASAGVDDPMARRFPLGSISDDDLSVRQAAWHVLSFPRGRLAPGDQRGIDFFLEHSQHRPQTVRIEAEAAGRLGDLSMVSNLVKLSDKYAGDRVIEHSIVYALIEMNAPATLVAALNKGMEPGDFVLLSALDQLGQTVPTERLRAEMNSREPRRREIAEWIAGHRPEYGEMLVTHLARALYSSPFHTLTKEPFGSQLAKFAHIPKVSEFIGRTLENDETREYRVIILRAIAKSGVKPVPSSWRSGVIKALRSQDLVLVPTAVQTTLALSLTDEPGEPLSKALIAVIENKATKDAVRLDALNALPDIKRSISDSIYTFLREQLDPEKPVSTRLAAADVLVKSKLSNEQLGKLAETLKTAGPLDVSRLLAVFDATTDDSIGRKLLDSLKDSPALTSLRVDTLKPRFAKFGKDVQTDAESLYTVIEKSLADQKSKLDDLAKNLPDGEVRRGQLVFNGTKSACATCHAIGYIGGNIGPDLSRIGSIRNDRDLLESIVFPNASFVRSYEPMVVATKAGQIHSGVLKKDSPSEVILTSGPDKEVRIPRADVDEMKPGTVSVMPSGLDSQMTKQELADLIAFLKSRK
jgi:putative membrane-bound dehydrogenase-like protein